MATQISLTQIRNMSDDDLKILALEKGHRGNASQAAQMAQKELFFRHGMVGRSSVNFKRLSDEWDEYYDKDEM